MGVRVQSTGLGGIAKPVNFWAELQGRSVGVDAFVWLHALAVGFATDVVEAGNFGGVAKAFASRAQRLRANGTDAIFVFDGKPVPVKAETAAKRRERRSQALAVAQGLKPGSEEYVKALRAAVSISPALVHAVLCELRTAGHRYIVAPFEADAQLRHLDQVGLVCAQGSEVARQHRCSAV